MSDAQCEFSVGRVAIAWDPVQALRGSDRRLGHLGHQTLAWEEAHHAHHHQIDSGSKGRSAVLPCQAVVPEEGLPSPWAGLGGPVVPRNWAEDFWGAWKVVHPS